MSKTYNVAIVGATGAVGTELLAILEERDFPVGELRLLASERSDGEFCDFRGDSLLVSTLRPDSFTGIDLAFFCAGSARSREFCPIATAAGAVCIDLTSAWSLDPAVPLVVPEVNPDDLAAFGKIGIVANPGSTVIPLVTVLKPLHAAARLKRLVIATYQAVSGSGQAGLDELRVQCGDLLNGRSATSSHYPQQIAFNCLPQIGPLLADGNSQEEMQLGAETRRILAAEDLRISATAVRIPVFYGHAEAVNLETSEPLAADVARTLLSVAPGCEVIDQPGENLYPTPATCVGQDLVQIGRIRNDASLPHGLNLWLCADNLRKGAATNAVQIAELLIEKYLPEE